MNRSGFTLLEIIIVLALAGILLSIATLNFNSWMKRSELDKQAKELYADIMNARQIALTTKINYGIVLGASATENPVSSYSFKRYSSEGGPQKVLYVKQVTYSVTKSNWVNPAKNEILFDERGIMVDPIDKTLCIFSTLNPALDALVITQSRVGLGKIINQGARNATLCKKANIELK